MAALDVALSHYRARERLVAAITAEASRLWAQIDASDINGSWRRLLPRLLVVLTAAQRAAASQADAYLDAVLAEQNIDPDSAGEVAPAALSGVASDGRPLGSLLDQPRIATLTAIGNGVAVGQAMGAGRTGLQLITSTQVADAGRMADQVALTARRHVGGYVRMLNPPSCSRCAILAGKWYRWSSGFERHPRCDCVHIPADEDTSDDLRTDPKQYFDSLTRAEQDAQFTAGRAEAIRLGADPSQVVNSTRGMYTAGGRSFTAEGTTRRGVAGKRLEAAGAQLTKRAGQRVRSVTIARPMPEQLIADAADRDDAIRLLKRFGYIF